MFKFKILREFIKTKQFKSNQKSPVNDDYENNTQESVFKQLVKRINQLESSTSSIYTDINTHHNAIVEVIQFINEEISKTVDNIYTDFNVTLGILYEELVLFIINQRETLMIYGKKHILKLLLIKS